MTAMTAMTDIDLDRLGGVSGGKSATQRADGSFEYKQSNYETCVDTIERRGAEVFPDNRGVLAWFGMPDMNAGPRAAWVRDSIPEACGMPPAG